jgi:hypothetical protein
MISRSSLSAVAFCVASVPVSSAVAQYVPSPKETIVIEALGHQEREVFAADGVSLLGAFLDVTHTSAREAARKYEENEVAADKQLYGKNVLLSGTVTAINSGIGNSPYLVLAARSAFQVQAHLVKTAIDRAALLKKGQKLTLFCQGAGAIAGSPMFRRCLFADDAAKEKWSELTTQIEAYHKGSPDVSPAVQHFAIAASAIATGLPSDACSTADKGCRAAVSKVMHSSQIRVLMSQAADRFKSVGLAVPSL